MKREVRSRVQIRAADVGGKPGVTLHAIRPNVVDDYGSVWAANAFDESLAQRLPTLTWSHDWSEPLGPAVGYRTGPDGPEIDFVFSDFEAVPMARRAYAQLQDGTILDCSVGFSGAVRRAPTADELRQFPGMTEYIERSGLDEVALVLRGAVPGAKVVNVRSASVGVDVLVELGRKVAAGEITEAEARAALALAGDVDDDGGGDGATTPPPGDEVDTAAELADAEALLEEAFDSVGRSARR